MVAAQAEVGREGWGYQVAPAVRKVAQEESLAMAAGEAPWAAGA